MSHEIKPGSHPLRRADYSWPSCVCATRCSCRVANQSVHACWSALNFNNANFSRRIPVVDVAVQYQQSPAEGYLSKVLITLKILLERQFLLFPQGFIDDNIDDDIDCLWRIFKELVYVLLKFQHFKTKKFSILLITLLRINSFSPPAVRMASAAFTLRSWKQCEFRCSIKKIVFDKALCLNCTILKLKMLKICDLHWRWPLFSLCVRQDQLHFPGRVQINKRLWLLRRMLRFTRMNDPWIMAHKIKYSV